MSPKSSRILSSLCYFSVLFAPFVFSVLVYLFTGEPAVQIQARKAFLSHILVLVAISLGITFSAESGFQTKTIIISAILFALPAVIAIVWNIVKGVKVCIR
ncbi:DUF4870 domain-containing protein [Fictibacillus sp. Mic-4]|uniref:hypothetical protein n=1 Tax=Fictibacillus TaxID=1329200 RepID=UPI00041C396B|nr:hypothetical protein [Fictibacillus gelatini]